MCVAVDMTYEIEELHLENELAEGEDTRNKLLEAREERLHGKNRKGGSQYG